MCKFNLKLPVWILERVNMRGHWRPYEMIYDDYDGQCYPGIDGVQVLPIFVLQLTKNTGKNHNQKNWPGPTVVQITRKI